MSGRSAAHAICSMRERSALPTQELAAEGMGSRLLRAFRRDPGQAAHDREVVGREAEVGRERCVSP
jgi:hypothetical protein